MKTIATIQSLESFASGSAKDWEMKAKLSTFLNSFINPELLTGEEVEKIKELAEYFQLETTLEKISKISV